MDTPVCFTQLFVDKQNVRSFSNIFKLSLLKHENYPHFLNNIFEESSLVSRLTPDIQEILFLIRSNLRNQCKDDFKSYFSGEYDGKMVSLNKNYIYSRCLAALLNIIPETLFGNKHNERLFKSLIEIIIHGMKWEHIQFGKFLRKWDISILPWTSLNQHESHKILYYILYWIIRNILSPMIFLNYHVTACKLDNDENKLHFFWKTQWQSFFDKSIRKMVYMGVIKKVERYSTGKKLKKNLDPITRQRLRKMKRDVPKLHLVLKVNGEFRPIIRYKSDPQTSIEKQILKRTLNFLRLLIGKTPPKMEIMYNSMYSKWLSLGKPKLYFIKTDLSNAFGSVDKGHLLKILQDKFLKYQMKVENIHTKDKNSKLFSEIFDKVKKHLLIRAGSTVYVWRKGLVQGYKYSPALSEIYYQHLDNLNFTEHLHCRDDDKIRLFIRVVDDYMYITDSVEDAYKFLENLRNYNNVNYQKTVVNFLYADVKFSDEVTFLGYTYRTLDLQVSRAQSVFSSQMCYKISFHSTINNIYKFLESRIGQSSMQINGHIFNFFYNKENLVWEHIFTTFCLSANKFCTILAILCPPDDMATFLQLYKNNVTVKLGNTIIDMLLRNKPSDFMFVYCINHIRYLSFLALSLCAKKTPKCTKIVPLTNIELTKSNCIFGKWKEHASRIDENGNKLRMATKAVCRRSDLRIIFRKFNNLPDIFQCYNHKVIYKT